MIATRLCVILEDRVLVEIRLRDRLDLCVIVLLKRKLIHAA